MTKYEKELSKKLDALLEEVKALRAEIQVYRPAPVPSPLPINPTPLPYIGDPPCWSPNCSTITCGTNQTGIEGGKFPVNAHCSMGNDIGLGDARGSIQG